MHKSIGNTWIQMFYPSIVFVGLYTYCVILVCNEMHNPFNAEVHNMA